MADEFQDEFEEFRARASSGGFLPYKKPQRVIIERSRRSEGSTHSERSVRSDRSTTSTEGYYGDTEEFNETSDWEPDVFVDSSIHRKHSDGQNVGLLLLSNEDYGQDAHHRPRLPSVSSAMARLKVDSNPVLEDAEWSIGDVRPRVSSMPVRNTFQRPVLSRGSIGSKPIAGHLSSLGLQKIRSFSITSKGLVKEGDFYLNKSHPNLLHPARKNGGFALRRTLVNRFHTGSTGSGRSFHIHVTGQVGVGVTTLIRQLVGSDLPSDVGLDDDGDKSVSILLDGEESTMEFVDLSDQEVNRFVTADQIDAYVVVYSVEDRKSFETAIDRLYEIRQEEGRHIAVILVANKTDLVRTRVVLGEEGKSAAKTYDCKYIEVSAAIDHKIDELLVGILKQIRLLRQRTEKNRSRNRKLDSEDYGKDSCCPLTAKQHVLGKIFHHEKFQSRSCDNLYVL